MNETVKKTEERIKSLRKRLDQLVENLDGFDKDEILVLSQELDKVLNELLDEKQINDK